MVFSCMAAPTPAAAMPVNPPLARGLDSEGGKSYCPIIPIRRLPGGAFVRASAFSLGSGSQAWRWARSKRGIFRIRVELSLRKLHARGAEEGKRMARIAGVNIPTNKRVEVALTYIHGIGRTTAQGIIAKLGITPEKRVQDLTDPEVPHIPGSIDKDFTAQ